MEEEGNFKVTLESLYTNRIKEISFDEEETYQEKPTLSQRLTELAQRVDFSTKVGNEGFEPAAKKGTQRWPWEVANSKLRQALTEISVLSDVIQIAQHQQKYVALDPVVASASGSASPVYQYSAKKKALGLAAEILKRGNTSLSLSSSDKEKEFHKTLSSLRQRWRLKRLASGAIVGDLGYFSSGSTYLGTVPFDLTKSKPQQEGGADPPPPPADSADSVIQVNLPREFRGSSEILVFLSSEPVQEIPPLSLFPPPLSASQLSEQRGIISPAELQLVAAQNVLFNQELFSQLAKEAYDIKPLLQHEVFTNRINVPLSMECWLSVVYVREYDHSPLPPSTSSFPPPHWNLTVALKQLLRESHSRRATLVVPRPSTAGFQEQPDTRNAGVVPLKGSQLKKLESQSNIFTQFISKAKHIYNEERLQCWLEELCAASVDPSLRVVWTPHPSLTLITACIIITDSLASSDATPETATQRRHSVSVVLKVDQVTVKGSEQEGKKELTFPFQREKLLSTIKHQVILTRMKLASGLARLHQWHVLQEMPRPLLSPALAKLQEEYSKSSNLLLEAKEGHQKLDLIFQWNSVCISQSTLTEGEALEGGPAQVDKWKEELVQLEELRGASFKEKLISLLTQS